MTISNTSIPELRRVLLIVWVSLKTLKPNFWGNGSVYTTKRNAWETSLRTSIFILKIYLLLSISFEMKKNERKVCVGSKFV